MSRWEERPTPSSSSGVSFSETISQSKPVIPPSASLCTLITQDGSVLPSFTPSISTGGTPVIVGACGLGPGPGGFGLSPPWLGCSLSSTSTRSSSISTSRSTSTTVTEPSIRTSPSISPVSLPPGPSWSLKLSL